MSILLLLGGVGRCGSMMAEQQCITAFMRGNKPMADLEQLLPLSAVRTITTKFKLPNFIRMCSMVTLLHLAAYWGWGDVVTALVSVYYCAANSKDDGGRTPLHYAAHGGHVEVVKYFISDPSRPHPLTPQLIFFSSLVSFSQSDQTASSSMEH